MNIYEKLLAVRQGFADAKIKKSGVNKFSGFNYFELSDIVPTITRLCTQVKALPLINYGEGVATLRFINAEKPEETIEISCEMKEGGSKGMNPAQAYGSVQTYTRRYLYLTLFDITEPDVLDAVTGKDEPPRAITSQPQRKNTAPKAAPKAEPKAEEPKLSPENKALINRMVVAYSHASGSTNKQTVAQIEEFFETKMCDITDEQAPEVVKVLNDLLNSANAKEQTA